MPQYCAVPLCRNSGGHLFPKDQKQRKKWTLAIRRSEKSATGRLWKPGTFDVVCYAHFNKEDYKPKICDGKFSFNFTMKKDECLCSYGKARESF